MAVEIASDWTKLFSEYLGPLLSLIGVDANILKLVESILTGSTAGNVIKLVLLIALVLGGWYLKRWRKKQAVKKTQEQSAKAESKLPQQTQATQASTSQDAGKVDDILRRRK